MAFNVNQNYFCHCAINKIEVLLQWVHFEKMFFALLAKPGVHYALCSRGREFSLGSGGYF